MNDTTLILHHYQSSPFSEKVRLAMGLKGLSWKSVTIPAMMPKPDLMPLTGGYRRTPVLQIGADIYCDTQLILHVIDQRFPEPTLYPAGQRGLGKMVSVWADRSFFATTVPVVFGNEGFNVPEAFRRDREQMSGRPFDTDQMRQVAPMMRDQWRGHVAWIEEALGDGEGDFLTGDAPGVADLSAYMNVWFLKNAVRPVYDGLMAPFTRTLAWCERIEALGHGRPDELPSADALAIAAAATPEAGSGVDPREAQGLRAGDLVTVSADDYGREPVTGTLVASASHEIAVRRTVEGLGELVVHFPRVGYNARRG